MISKHQILSATILIITISSIDSLLFGEQDDDDHFGLSYRSSDRFADGELLRSTDKQNANEAQVVRKLILTGALDQMNGVEMLRAIDPLSGGLLSKSIFRTAGDGTLQALERVKGRDALRLIDNLSGGMALQSLSHIYDGDVLRVAPHLRANYMRSYATSRLKRPSLDTMSGASIGYAKRGSLDPMSGMSFGTARKRNFDEIDNVGFNGFVKKNFDEIDRSGFNTFSKRNFDEIDRSGFGGFVKKNFDEIDRAGFNGFTKRNFDEIDRSGFGGFVKKRNAQIAKSDKEMLRSAKVADNASDNKS